MTGAEWLAAEGLSEAVPIRQVIDALDAGPPETVRVLGADGFLEPSRPSLDHIFDLGRPPGVAPSESVNLALAVLKRWPSHLLVELVVE